MIFSMNKSSFLPVDTPVLFVALFLVLTLLLIIIVTIKFKGRRTKIIGSWILTWFVVGSILFSSGIFGKFVDIKAADKKNFTREELTEDLNQLEGCIMKENPLYFADREELNKLFAVVRKKIESGMTELEFYRLINPVVTAVNCGHTNLSISEGLIKNRENTAKFFPYRVTLVNNQLYLLEGDREININAGDKIKSINGRSSSEIIDILLKNISGDGDSEAKQRYIISKHFNNRYYDFVDTSDNFHVELISPDGVLKEADLKAKYVRPYNTSAMALHFAEYQDGNYYESILNDNYAVLTVNVFMQEKDNKFASFLENFFLELEDQNISKLILDLRGNFGANPRMAQTLMSYLISEKTPYFNCDLPFLFNLMGYQKPIIPAKHNFDGDLVVLTDGACFSTTGHFCALVKHHKLGKIIGTETGGTYVCTDSSKDTVLKNTRIRLHYSTRVYKVDVKGFPANRGVYPDIIVSPTIDDILSNRDVQMERALNVLKL